MKLKLIEGWKTLYKAWSVWCMTAVFAILALPDLLPEVAAYLSHEHAQWLALAGIVARAIKQGRDDAAK